MTGVLAKLQKKLAPYGVTLRLEGGKINFDGQDTKESRAMMRRLRKHMPSVACMATLHAAVDAATKEGAAD